MRRRAPLLALWPVQNGPELGGGIGEAFSHPMQRIREDFGTTRLDYNVSDERHVSSRVYTVDDSVANTPSANPLSTVVESLREQVASVQEQHIFSPALLNTARVGFSRASYFFTGETPVDLPGWVAGAPIGAVVIGGGTALNGASRSAARAPTPAATCARCAISSPMTITWLSRTASIRSKPACGSQRVQANDNLAQDQYGQASFGSLTSFLQGTVSTFTVVAIADPAGLAVAGRRRASCRTLSSCGPISSLRVGFRFESTNGWNEAHGRASTTSSIRTASSRPIRWSGAPLFTVNRAKFLPEPRVGLAWDPFGKGRTVIHAGFGIYRALLDNLDYRLDQTAPFNATESLQECSRRPGCNSPGSPLPAGTKISPSGVAAGCCTPRR